MCASFQDYSWIQDFEDDFPQSHPQNAEFSLSKDNWPFNLEIVDI